MVKKGDRYDASELEEAQFEPGSRGRVLKNLLGIKSQRDAADFFRAAGASPFLRET
jgi:hypothetical protein